MVAQEGFRLVEVDPKTIRRGRPTTTLYRDIIGAFLKGAAAAAEVTGTGRRPATLVSGLQKARVQLVAPVQVSTRGEQVFLVRK